VGNKACEECKGTGLADSGGSEPWGDPIYIPCGCDQKIELYRPSNATEGDSFMSSHCYQCKHDDCGIGEKVCDIIGNTMVYDIRDPEYPTEWRYGIDGMPTCTRFEEDTEKA
jgi:hypothetical protein